MQGPQFSNFAFFLFSAFLLYFGCLWAIFKSALPLKATHQSLYKYINLVCWWMHVNLLLHSTNSKLQSREYTHKSKSHYNGVHNRANATEWYSHILHNLVFLQKSTNTKAFKMSKQIQTIITRFVERQHL